MHKYRMIYRTAYPLFIYIFFISKAGGNWRTKINQNKEVVNFRQICSCSNKACVGNAVMIQFYLTFIAILFVCMHYAGKMKEIEKKIVLISLLNKGDECREQFNWYKVREWDNVKMYCVYFSTISCWRSSDSIMSISNKISCMRTDTWI